MSRDDSQLVGSEHVATVVDGQRAGWIEAARERIVVRSSLQTSTKDARVVEDDIPIYHPNKLTL